MRPGVVCHTLLSITQICVSIAIAGVSRAGKLLVVKKVPVDAALVDQFILKLTFLPTRTKLHATVVEKVPVNVKLNVPSS